MSQELCMQMKPVCGSTSLRLQQHCPKSWLWHLSPALGWPPCWSPGFYWPPSESISLRNHKALTWMCLGRNSTIGADDHARPPNDPHPRLHTNAYTTTTRTIGVNNQLDKLFPERTNTTFLIWLRSYMWFSKVISELFRGKTQKISSH